MSCGEEGIRIRLEYMSGQRSDTSDILWGNVELLILRKNIKKQMNHMGGAIPELRGIWVFKRVGRVSCLRGYLRVEGT